MGRGAAAKKGRGAIISTSPVKPSRARELRVVAHGQTLTRALSTSLVKSKFQN
jgi:hypothetical protein